MTRPIPPYILSFDEERGVSTLPAIDRWSENYAFAVYDYERRTGFAAYAGRWIKDPNLWREQLNIYLPDGSVLLHMAIGPAPSAEIVGAGAMRFTCEQPGGRWHISFDGGMRHERPEDLLGSPLSQRVPTPVHFSATIDHDMPVWMFPTSDNSSHGKFHYEQLGRAEGAFSFGGESYALAGPAYRDHSRGPRHLGGYQGHVWLQLHFTDRPPLTTYQAWAKENGELQQILDQTVTIHADGFAPARILTPLRLTALENLAVPIVLDVEIDGELLHLEGKPLATMVSSLTEEFDFFYGFPKGQADIVSTEQPYLFEGPSGPVTAYLQRSLRLERNSA